MGSIDVVHVGCRMSPARLLLTDLPLHTHATLRTYTSHCILSYTTHLLKLHTAHFALLNRTVTLLNSASHYTFR